MKTYKILVVEDHDSSSKGIIETLNGSKYTFDIVVRTTADEAYIEMADMEFDAVLLDIFLGREVDQFLLDGDDLLHELNKKEDRPPIIIFSKVDRIETLDYVIHNLGAEAYILKGRRSLEEIIPAFEHVIVGGTFYSKRIAKILTDNIELIEIDRTDKMILRFLTQGLTQKEIPSTLDQHGIKLSGRGMEKRIRRMKFKFGSATLSQLMYDAIREGIIRLE